MRTLIEASWILGFKDNQHRMIKDGVIVYEDDKIIHLGKTFNGQVDKTIKAPRRLVIPGLINIHAVTSICITHFRIDGVGVGGKPRTKQDMLDGIKNPIPYLEGEDLQTSARFSFAELLKGGATTIVEITAFGTTGFQPPLKQAETFVKMTDEFKARSYISHPYTDAKKYSDETGTHYYFDKEAGLRALDNAKDFCERHEGTQQDRVRTMLFPYMFDACSERLLRETKKVSLEKDLPIHMHTAQYLPEFYESLRRYGKTPVKFLYDIGFLGPKTILTHLLYTSLNPVSQAPNKVKGDPEDIHLLAKTGTTLGHTPLVWSRVGLGLESYAKFRAAGVNIGIGTDAFPMDMIMEMRNAAVMGKVAERSRSAVTAKDVFNAATLGGAKALGRTDIGRLTPGSKADIVIVDLSGINMALTYDPIKTLVYFGSQKDIETVIIDGNIIVENGQIPWLDEEKLAIKADKVNHRWAEKMGLHYPMSAPSWNN